MVTIYFRIGYADLPKDQSAIRNNVPCRHASTAILSMMALKFVPMALKRVALDQPLIAF